ncbi:MAG: hypothetical protein R6X02_24260 [Enhygromyxa sp.]
MIDGAEQVAQQTALAKRQPAPLPRLLTPRQVSWRAIGVVLAAESGALALAWATGSLLGSFGLALGAIVVWSVHRRTEAQRAIAGIERARELIDLNRIDEAAGLLDEILERRATPPHTRPLAAYNRALVALRRARFDQARARLDAVLESGWLENRRFLQNFAPTVHAAAMLTAVLQGDLAAAERYHQAGRASAFDLERHWFVAESFDLARRERFAELLDKFERSWEAIEGTVSGVGIRQLQLLQAYALTRVGEREDNYRGLHSGEDIQPLLHGIRAGRFDHLATRWPELRDFMRTHGLLARAADEP